MSSRAAVAPPEAVRTAVRQSILPLVLFCVGHFLVDLYSGALGALRILAFAAVTAGAILLARPPKS